MIDCSSFFILNENAPRWQELSSLAGWLPRRSSRQCICICFCVCVWMCICICTCVRAPMRLCLFSWHTWVAQTSWQKGAKVRLSRLLGGSAGRGPG